MGRSTRRQQCTPGPKTPPPETRPAVYYPLRSRREEPPGRSSMSQLSRRQFLEGATAAAAATTLAAPHVHAQKSGGTLRFVAQADLNILAPVWTNAYITRNHAYLVYDTLFGTDDTLQVRPQMVAKHGVSKDAMKYT